jgi:hypothetical protein
MGRKNVDYGLGIFFNAHERAKTEHEKKNLHNDVRKWMLTAQKKRAIIVGNQGTYSSGDFNPLGFLFCKKDSNVLVQNFWLWRIPQ